MLAKKYRLPVQKFLSQRSQARRSDYFLLKIFSSTGTNSRFGVIISKHVQKSAAGRNRLKRLMFRFFQETQGQIPRQDFLVIALPAAGRLIDYQEVNLELQKLFGIYN